VYRERVPLGLANRSALAYLTERRRHSTEATWRERLAAGQVRLDGRVATATDVVEPGQELAWSRPPWHEPQAPMTFAVLHRDEHLLAVAKPRGLPCVPSGGYLTHTLLHVVRERFQDATPLHRLGRGTSGLVLFARTREARSRLSAAWREGAVTKIYRALAAGVPGWSELTIEAPIGPVSHPRLGSVHAATRDGRPACTQVRRLAIRDGNAIVEARIPTGRPHQIRIHLAAAGHPLVGDPLYAAGGGLRTDPGLPVVLGCHLHAQRLVFEHPVSGRRIELECAPPPLLRC